MTRLQRILALVLVGQLIVTAVVFWPRSQVNAETAALFPDLETADIVRFSLEDNQGQRVELTRQGGGWVLADRGDYPADGSKIEPVLTKIAALQTERLVTQSAASHKRLQVGQDDFNRRATLETKDGNTLVLYVGSSPNPNATHVRRDGQEETYLASDLASWELNAAAQNWIDATYLSLNREEITRLVLENRNGAFQFDKQPDDTWTMVGLAESETLNMTNFNPILNQAINLRMVAPLGLEEKEEYGLAAPQAKVSITTTREDGSSETAVLRVGSQLPGESNYAVKWSDSSYFVSAAEFSVQSMIERTREELIQLPTTPTPEG